MRSLLVWIAVASLLGLGARLSGGVLGWAGEGPSTRTSHWADGTPKETAVFVGGLRHGPCERFHPDGSPRARGEFRGGRMEGAWRFFGADGRLDEQRSGRYADGQRVGPLDGLAAGPSAHRSAAE